MNNVCSIVHVQYNDDFYYGEYKISYLIICSTIENLEYLKCKNMVILTLTVLSSVLLQNLRGYEEKLKSVTKIMEILDGAENPKNDKTSCIRVNHMFEKM